MTQDAREASAVHPQEIKDPILSMDNFCLDLDGRRVLSDISFSVPRGAITALVGPSGSGKTVLLRSFNRMNEWDGTISVQGSLEFESQDIHSPATDLLELRGRMGMVFRIPNAFSMSVFDNVAYALRAQSSRPSRRLLDEGVERALRRCGLWDDLRDRLAEPAVQLPPGLQQRLCVARAVACSPAVLLLDEPCSMLDPLATAELEDLLLSLGGNPTVVIVTHNPQQASRISQYTAFLSRGRLVEFGPTERVFQRPLRRETDDYISGRSG